MWCCGATRRANTSFPRLPGDNRSVCCTSSIMWKLNYLVAASHKQPWVSVSDSGYRWCSTSDGEVISHRGETDHRESFKKSCLPTLLHAVQLDDRELEGVVVWLGLLAPSSGAMPTWQDEREMGHGSWHLFSVAGLCRAFTKSLVFTFFFRIKDLKLLHKQSQNGLLIDYDPILKFSLTRHIALLKPELKNWIFMTFLNNTTKKKSRKKANRHNQKSSDPPQQ